MIKKETEKVLKKQIELIKPSKEVLEKIQKINDDFVEKLESSLKKHKINAKVFLGGSLAKGTIIKKENYDVDIFVRFDQKYKDENISEILKKSIPENIKKIHGSRDYFQIGKDGVLIEIIPVLSIKKPENALNVTDLSYFHVNYVLGETKKNKRIVKDILLAKSFTHANDCYGAESYIMGFSGYALELLIIHYKSFLKFIQTIADLDFKKEKLIIDDQKHYKNKEDLIENLNKSKRNGPIILIDPTFKERNALSSLSYDTLFKFQEYCRNFLKKPSLNSFIKKDIFLEFKNEKDVKILRIAVSRQAGDISGTKSKKFFNYFISLVKKDFNIKKYGFDYKEDENLSYFYLIIKKKNTEVIRGPPLTSLENLNKFKKVHPDAFVKDGYAFVKKEYNLNFKEWFKKFSEKNKKVIESMDVGRIELIK